MTILTICSAYTHYFSGITSGVLYLILLIYFIRNNKSQIKYWFSSSLISILCFCPWIPNLIKQIFHNKGVFWIEQMSVQRVIGFIFFIFSPVNQMIKGNEICSPSILGILLLISFLILVFLFVKEKNKDLTMKYAIYGMLVILFVSLIGIIGSLIINPFIHPRYLIPAMGLLWLGISILLAKNYDKKQIFIPILIIILICSVLLVKEEYNCSNQYRWCY